METMFNKAITTLVLWAAFTSPSLARTGESVRANKTAKPYVPIAWAWEQKAIAERRQDFLNHIKGASNISIPSAPDDFAWEIDWNARNAYCQKIADDLFTNPPKLKFPEPFYSENRDDPKKSWEFQKLTFPKCLYKDGTGAGFSNDLLNQYDATVSYAIKVNAIKRNQQSRLSQEVAASRGYRSAQENESAGEYFVPAGRKFVDLEISSQASAAAGTDSQDCEAHVVKFKDEKMTPDYPFAAGGRTSAANVLVVQTSDGYMAAQYGTYEVSKGDVPLFDKNSEYKLRPDGNTIWLGTGRIQLHNVKQNSTWGTKGQGFVIIRVAGKTLKDTWAIAGEVTAAKMYDVVPKRSLSGDYFSEGQNSCVINFDKALPSK